MDPTPRTWRKSSYSGADSGNCVEVASARPAPSPPATSGICYFQYQLIYLR
jgi:hypothetical protein